MFRGIHFIPPDTKIDFVGMRTISWIVSAFLTLAPLVLVATVGLNGSKNAGVLAAQIIATGDETVAKSVAAYKEKQAKDVLAKDMKLQEKGYKKYLEEN